MINLIAFQHFKIHKILTRICNKKNSVKPRPIFENLPRLKHQTEAERSRSAPAVAMTAPCCC